MIAVTGGAGFIGSALVWELNRRGRDDVLIVDSFLDSAAWHNLLPLRFVELMPPDEFLARIAGGSLNESLDGILHMGACSDTTQTDAAFMMRNNYRCTRSLAEWAIAKGKRFVYASSAATYGGGSVFSDDHSLLHSLKPLNLYAWSKHLFDCWALDTGALSHIAGLKFFNVFGPNEYHKGSMRSVALKAFEEICTTGQARLFQSYQDGIADGEQRRDFVYVKEIVEMTLFVYFHPEQNGIFNAGSGEAHTFRELVEAVFCAMGRSPEIEYIEMPEQLRGVYQYYTRAEMRKLCTAGYQFRWVSLEDAVADYVRNYLLAEERFLHP